MSRHQGRGVASRSGALVPRAGHVALDGRSLMLPRSPFSVVACATTADCPQGNCRPVTRNDGPRRGRLDQGGSGAGSLRRTCAELAGLLRCRRKGPPVSTEDMILTAVVVPFTSKVIEVVAENTAGWCWCIVRYRYLRVGRGKREGR